MTITNFFNLFLIVSALHGFAFSLILFFSKYGKDKSMLYLNLMLLSLSLNNFQSWLYIHAKAYMTFFDVPWHFLGAPFFYTFLIHYLKINKKSIKILKPTFIVFCILCIAQLIFVFCFKDLGDFDQLHYLFGKYRSFEEAFSFIVSISVFGYSFYILYKKEKLFPKILMFDDLKWIYTFFKLISFVYLFWVLALFFRFKLNFSDYIFSYYPLRIFTTIVIYLLGYEGLKYSRILKERKHIREYIEEDPPLLNKEHLTKNTELVANKKEIQFKEIDSFIKQNKKYLQPKYSLQNLSNEINIGASTLSAVINNNAHKTFVDYINEMRVEQSKKLLVDKKYVNYTIVSIGLESGFNSKSAFYNVFKKHVGCTPLAYKNKQNVT